MLRMVRSRVSRPLVHTGHYFGREQCGFWPNPSAKLAGTSTGLPSSTPGRKRQAADGSSSDSVQLCVWPGSHLDVMGYAILAHDEMHPETAKSLITRSFPTFQGTLFLRRPDAWPHSWAGTRRATDAIVIRCCPAQPRANLRARIGSIFFEVRGSATAQRRRRPPRLARVQILSFTRMSTGRPSGLTVKAITSQPLNRAALTSLVIGRWWQSSNCALVAHDPFRQGSVTS